MNNAISRFYEPHRTSYDTALGEIRRGKKTSHWMWYIFPQLKQRGRSSMATYYGLEDIEEAKAYVADELLYTHLVEISSALLELNISDPNGVFGSPDDKKLRSSMTLFAVVCGENSVFQKVLDKFYDGKPDYYTLKILGKN